MKLFYLQGSCALAPHIALEHAGLVYEAVRVERGKQADASYLRINPLGRVPALVTASHGTITEVSSGVSRIGNGWSVTSSRLRTSTCPFLVAWD